jgi:hypothetical protein
VTYAEPLALILLLTYSMRGLQTGPLMLVDGGAVNLQRRPGIISPEFLCGLSGDRHAGPAFNRSPDPRGNSSLIATPQPQDLSLKISKREMVNHMSIEQNATQWIDSQIQTKSRKSINHARSRRRSERRERPLNVLGCLALIYAIRSADSGDRARVAARRATTA